MTSKLKIVCRRLMLLQMVLLLGILATPGVAMAADTQYVQLVIDFGDGFEKRYTEIAPRVDFTVMGVLQAATRHPRGFKLVHRGSGATAFVTTIDGQQNQGGGVEAKNWRFYRNNQLGKQGAGVEPVKAGDVVLWKFETGS